MSNGTGLWVNLGNFERSIKLNALKEVTNPIMLDSHGGFTPDGVLSYEIFGVSNEDRRNRCAYIDLHGHYMYPLAATKLAAYDRKLADCLNARGLYSVTKDGQLVEDPNGNSGPEYLYKIWGKVKVKDKSTVATKEVQKFFEKSRDKLFTTKWGVIPAFFRDINVADGRPSKSSNMINSWYNSIISYTQSMDQFSDGFGTMTRLTQARVQNILNEIYDLLMINTVKGKPSKFGMLRRSLAGKNLPYTTRLVITAPNTNKTSLSQMQVKFGYATIPLQYICSMFLPFMVHELKEYFEQTLIRSGKIKIGDDYVTFPESFDENQLTGMINKFINSPGTRFDPVMLSPDSQGITHKMVITGRYHKDNTTFERPATYTDLLYVIAERVTKDKHVYVTRYPMDNINGQNPYRIIVSTTNRTKPATIGDTVYEHYPIIEGDPMNAFMSTAQFSNTMIGPMGADFDGDQVSCKAVWTKEANEDAERYIRSNAYITNITGNTMRDMTKDFVLCQYNLTNIKDKSILTADCNKVAPKYAV